MLRWNVVVAIDVSCKEQKVCGSFGIVLALVEFLINDDGKRALCNMPTSHFYWNTWHDTEKMLQWMTNCAIIVRLRMWSDVCVCVCVCYFIVFRTHFSASTGSSESSKIGSESHKNVLASLQPQPWSMLTTNHVTSWHSCPMTSFWF